MNIGTRLYAPEGCRFFPKETYYYLLASTSDPVRVLLVHFEIKVSDFGLTPKKSTLIQLPRRAFEEECLSERIIPAREQHRAPPWLGVHGPIERYLESSPGAAAEVEARMAAIQPALKQWASIRIAARPEQRLGEMARALGKNESRYRLWVFSYFLFGCTPSVLAPGHLNGGRWVRANKKTDLKLGRPSLIHGKHHGHNLTSDQHERIKLAYKKRAGLGVTMGEIYAKSIREDWGCKAIGEGGHAMQYVHPLGAPFPTAHQFAYYLKKIYGVERLQIDRYGAERVRQRLAGNRGSFVEGTANLMEHVEFDAYTIEGRPEAIDGTALKPLYVVRARDRLSGMFVGIGFSLGGEKESAYRMAIFCMLISKVHFCALFGLTIRHCDWPSEGIADIGILDRGPGSIVQSLAAIREMAPAYAGQAKAIVETSHPKQDDVSGAPSYVTSGKNPIQMAVAELVSTIEANKSMNMRSRMTPTMRDELELSTPLAIYNHFDSLGRNAAVRVPFQKVVRDWCERTDIVVNADGAWCENTLFTSDLLRKSKLLARAKAHAVSVPAYFLPFVVRSIWMELDGEVTELSLHLPFADSDDQRNVSYRDLKILQGKDSIREAKMREVKIAARIEAADRYEEQFGAPYDEARRHLGRAKVRTEQAREMSKLYEEFIQ